jgi:hypothetical protein
MMVPYLVAQLALFLQRHLARGMGQIQLTLLIFDFTFQQRDLGFQAQAVFSRFK